jgi:hypothetical protein
MSFVRKAYLPLAIIVTTIVIIVATVAAALIHERRHPCLEYSTHKVFVPEMTTYTTVGQVTLENGITTPGVQIPNTVPAHYEDVKECVERKK